MTIASIVKLSIAELFGLAEVCRQAGQTATVVDVYKNWIACHPDDPSLYAAYFNYGTALSAVADNFGAVIAFRESARLKPDFHQACLSLGLVLEKLGQSGLAVSQWLGVARDLGTITGEAVHHRIMALENTGRVLEGMDQDRAAEDALRERLDLGLDDKVIQHWIALRMRQCKWPVLVTAERLTRRDLLAGISPLSLASLSDDPFFQLARAARYNRTLTGHEAPAVLAPLPHPQPLEGRRLRIGYVSSDLREHAVGFSIVDTLEQHDRAHVEVMAYYCGIARDDPTKARIKAAVDSWVDINGLSDGEAAQRMRDDRIDILIDLNGYTKDARTAVFALRPAPITVNWFGYPATMGSPCHHYLIADATTVPEGSARFYSETVVRLPCYQPNDRKRLIAATPPTRADEDLPEGRTVFCSLNGLHKLTARTVERWLTILLAVPDSVLWLLAGTPDTQERLRGHAAARGVAPGRLVFAAKRQNPDHVARYALADLFLDHGPYGAHTTAADALWMGVPVLTCPGRSFASRVCASLVGAAGLHALICATPSDYVRLAVELGRDRERLAALRRQLLAGRDTCLLFDTPRLVGHLEALYARMWDDYVGGHLPAPDLDGLDVLHAVGLETAVEDTEDMDDDAYHAHYAQGADRWTVALGHPVLARLRRD